MHYGTYLLRFERFSHYLFLKMIRNLIFVLPKIEKMLYLKEQINPSSLWDFNVTVSVTKPEFLAVPE